MIERARGGHMVAIVTGDRHATLETWGRIVWWALYDAIGYADTWTLCHGNQRGIDRMSEAIALEETPTPAKVRRYDADWDQYGNQAGPIRNFRMLHEAHEASMAHGFPLWVLAFHDDLTGTSRGTRDCVMQARKMRIPVAHYHSNGSFDIWRPDSDEREERHEQPAEQQVSLDV